MHVHIWPSRTRSVAAANAAISVHASWRGLVGGPRHGVEVVVDPHRLPRPRVGVPRDVAHDRPLLGGVDADEVEPPALGNEDSESHGTERNERRAGPPGTGSGAERQRRACLARSGTVGCVATPDPRSIRIGNAEREQAVTALGDHFAQGRLNPEEFEERMTAAYAARTAHDLDRLFEDLPGRRSVPDRAVPDGPVPAGPIPDAASTRRPDTRPAFRRPPGRARRRTPAPPATPSRTATTTRRPRTAATR